MSNLVVIAYPQQAEAERVQGELRMLEAQHLLEIDDSAYVTKDADGTAKLHQSFNTTAVGAAGGAFWGTMVGLLLFAPLAGLAVGAGAGAVMGKLSDAGINDKFMKELSEQLKPDSSAIFLLVRNVTVDKVLPQVSKFGGTVLRTSLPNDVEERLQRSLSEGFMRDEEPHQ